MDDYILAKENFEGVKVKGFRQEFKLYEGILLPTYVQNMSIFKKIELRNDDLFVIGVPKSGTTWVEEICWLIQNNLDYERAKNEFHFSRVRFIDTGLAKASFDMMESPRTFKTHFRLKFLPENIEKKSKIVYVYRNPKDVIVSLFNFSQGFRDNEFDGTFDELVDSFVNEMHWYGNWWDHVDEYLNTKGIFAIKYEDMLQNQVELTKNLVKYLEKDYTDEQIKELIEFCSFKNLKKSEAFDKEILQISSIFNANVEFFRKGEKGNWKDYFSQESADKLDKVLRNKFKHLNQNMDYLSQQVIPISQKSYIFQFFSLINSIFNLLKRKIFSS